MDFSNPLGDAFSYVAMTFGIGLIIGPVLGGFLTNPTTNFPWLFGNVQFLKDYPYFLPCGVSSLLCATGFFLAFFFLDETLRRDEAPPQTSEVDASAPLLQPRPSSSPAYNSTQLTVMFSNAMI